MTVLLDASAVLAFRNDETGSDVVEAAMARGAVIGAANWSEIAQKVQGRSGEWGDAKALLLNYAVHVEPVTRADADDAALRWQRGPREQALVTLRIKTSRIRPL